MGGGVRGPGGRSSPTLGGTPIDIDTANSAGTSGASARSDHQHRIPAKWRHEMLDVYKDTADATALVATAQLPVGQLYSQSTPNSFRFVPSAAVAANITNYATLTVSKHNGAGGLSAVVATAITSSTGMGAFQGFIVTITDGAAIAQGWVLTFEITKQGSGVIIPTGTLYCDCLVD